jgi:hypothetical protein
MADEKTGGVNAPLKNEGAPGPEKPTDKDKDAVKKDSNIVNLRVKPVMQIPHIVTFKQKDYIFAPDEEVPKELADALLKNQSHIYEIAKGEPEKKAYTVKTTYEAKQIGELFKDLSQAEKTEVINLIKKIHQRRQK